MEENNSNVYASLTKRYNEFNIIKARIDTQPLIDQIEVFLRGAKITIIQDEAGRPKSKKVSYGVPKANDQGIQSIINWISATVNAQTVQGNFYVDKHGYSEDYCNFCADYREDFATYVVANVFNWGILESDIDGIVCFVMLLAEPFFSRLIENKERDSYGESMKSEQTVTERSKGGIPLLN